VLAPFSYTQLLWVSVLGFLIFGEVPDVYTITGAAFIVASGLYTAHRERVRRSQLLAVAASRRRTPDPAGQAVMARPPKRGASATAAPQNASVVAQI
jgi:hypothetical protein